MTPLSPARERVRAVEPAKRWRNRWWSEGEIEYLDGHIDGPGYFLGNQWPSKDVALTVADDFMAEIAKAMLTRELCFTVKYLGPEPENAE